MPAGRPSSFTQEIADEICGVSGVYALSCPDSGRVMYVGQSSDIGNRFKQHCRISNNTSHRNVCKWVYSLLSNGKEPLVSVLEETKSLNDAEVKWIARFDGLLNMNEGGQCMSHLKRAKVDMPWGNAQAPMQKAIITVRRTARDLNSEGLHRKADIMQTISAELKKDKRAWITANVRLAERFNGLSEGL